MNARRAAAARETANGASTAPSRRADEVVVLYIAGSGRSGSTLLERMLGAIPGFTNVGELIDLPRRVLRHDELCGCGESFSSCPFWSAVGRRTYGGWSARNVDELHRLQRRVARQRHLPQLVAGAAAPGRFREELERYAGSYDRLYRAVADVSGARVVVDASKGAAHALALSRADGIDLRLLHLVRDARGVAFSWAKADVDRPQSGSPGTTMATHQPHLTALRWAALQNEVAAVRRVLEGPSVRVRYEDLVARPLDELTRALRALELHVDESDLGHVQGHTVDLGVSHGLSGNPSRLRYGKQRLRLDEQWRSDMPSRDRRIITAIAGLPLARFGYLSASGFRRSV